ncbi:MAG: response regulator [Bacteroidales bacterium]|nr:response regulator [Bacteroidales bacterium]
MNKTKKNNISDIKAILLIIAILLNYSNKSIAIDIERFEHLNSSDGLSQNTVLSLFCDHKGFMWMGTMDGLNRYDGYNFKILKSKPGTKYSLTNNRIKSIWEDERFFLWVLTYDDYVHWFDPSKEEFYTIPFYHRSEEERNSKFTYFCQESEDEIWIGTSNSGVYHLVFDSIISNYNVAQYLSRGVSAITNNEINFILSDPSDHIWIGTRQGLNRFDKKLKTVTAEIIEHFNIHYNFSSAIEMQNEIWFGTKGNGILIYNFRNNQFVELPEEFIELKNAEITLLKKIKNEKLVIGTDKGLFIYNPLSYELTGFKLNGDRVTSVFEDSFGTLWINTEVFGVTRIDSETPEQQYYMLTPAEIKPLVDAERQYFYEDSGQNLWIGLHGAGLAHYIREEKRFEFFRNNPNDPTTLSSNFAHCIAEDKSGLLWIGTGQFNGGVSKVIPANPSFENIILKKNITDMSDNVIRSIFEDSRRNIWMATKSGTIYIYDSSLKEITVLEDLPLIGRKLPGYNIYTMLQDSQGYIWLGSKGGGVAVSTKPLNYYKSNYNDIAFHLYRNLPGKPSSLSSNNIYSIVEDHDHRIWIGTYGGGLNLVKNRNRDDLFCSRFDHANSNISCNEIRHLLVDSKGSLWIASIFGINLLEGFHPEIDSASFRHFSFDPQKSTTICYNDIVHIFEDKNRNLWFSTFGGGVSRLINLTKDSALFQSFNSSDGMVNDAVFGILQDNENNLWFSTESGISKFNLANLKFENFDKNNGLQSDRFSENTCCTLYDGRMVFGSTNGALVVDPEKFTRNSYIPPIVFTNFQLFNKDVDFWAPDAPFNKSIEFLEEIVLKHFQSSFSIEYAALSFFDPKKSIYSFKLAGFEDNWNDVGNMTRATYTNLSPGKYEFQVKAANWDGTWNPEPRTIKITILPPWYKTVWAYIGYAILIIILGEITRRILTKYNHMRNDLRVERRVNDIKLQFFTNVSHEIRTPLTLILGPLDDIKAHLNLPESLKQSFNIMERNGKRMLRLVNQLLDFRKIQKNKMRLKVSEVELVDFVKEVCDNFKQMAQQKQVNFACDSKIDNCKVWVDPDKLDSVLFNIISNAFKFSKKHKTIHVQIKSPDPEYVSIEIKDEGKGIAKDKILVLFDRYTPLSVSDINYQGTGIGLSLSYEIMKLHKGEIDVRSEVNKGSTFIIKIKLGKDHFEDCDFAEEIIGSSAHRVIELPENEGFEIHESGKKIKTEVSPTEYLLLLVEDNEEIIDYVKNILQANFTIDVAFNGAEGLKYLESNHPDLIITDLMMPEMDGLTMTKIIKANFAISHIPVVILTAKTQIEYQIEGIETGAEAYILKPFNAEYLKAVIENILKQRKIIIEKLRDKKDTAADSIKITPKDEKFLNDIIDIIEKNYSDPIFNVEKLVDYSNVGRTVMYNKIKGLTGISPVEFLRDMRLQISARFLVESGYSISEVGYMCGFNDIKYFSKCFKAKYGVTPSVYKSSK